jgi:hypothetical protein
MDKKDDDSKDKKKVQVTLVWGGTGASKEVNAARTDTASEVFKEVYEKFKQTPTDQDTFELNGQSFGQPEFSSTVEQLLQKFGHKLTFEVIPPTSGA